MPRNYTGRGLLTAGHQRLGVVRYDLDEAAGHPPSLSGFISGNASVIEKASTIGGVELHDLIWPALRLELVNVYPQGVAEVTGHLASDAGNWRRLAERAPTRLSQ
jgi:hypothetical protein